MGPTLRSGVPRSNRLLIRDTPDLKVGPTGTLNQTKYGTKAGTHETRRIRIVFPVDDCACRAGARAEYDLRSGDPDVETVVGHEPGDAITTPEQIGRYLDALAKAAPDRTRLVKYATSWEGRPLHYLIVGSKERIARLDEVKRGMQVLASGAPEADRLIAELPVVVWLLHGVHGNEISSSDAALAEAYHLLAARGNADVGPRRCATRS